MLRLIVRSGTGQGKTFDARGEVVRIGRAPTNDLVVDDTHVSGEHACIFAGPAAPTLEDLGSTNGTSIVRRGVRTTLENRGQKAVLEDGDVVELGGGEAITQIDVKVQDDADDARVVAVRRIDDFGRITAGVEENPRSLSALYGAQKRIGAATDLDGDSGRGLRRGAVARPERDARDRRAARRRTKPARAAFVPVADARARAGRAAGPRRRARCRSRAASSARS